jgi:hypothetical protein
MGKVLMILYRFPPMGGSGVQRGLKFTKYLGDFGWEPMVITARGNVDISEDKSYEKEIPSGLKIWRVPALVPAIVNQIFGINNNAYN